MGRVRPTEPTRGPTRMKMAGKVVGGRDSGEGGGGSQYSQ
jgi:hypothetical protein